ncbi:MAG: hypothetical protein QOI02_1579 [Actinomycetota bacterium]|nr:hypothetical protein [Actinomycetota bacterium]
MPERQVSLREPSNRHTVRIAAVAATIAVLATLTACTAAPAAPATGAPSPSSVPSAFPTEVSPPGDVPDTQAYVAYTAPDGSFSLKVPEGWAQSTTGSSTTFTDKLNSVALESTAATSAPTVASAKAKELAHLAAVLPKFSLTTVTTFTRPGGRGVMATYLADSAPSPVTGSVVRDAGELFLFWKNGKQVAVTLTSPQGADNVDPWNIVTRSFLWLK